MVNGDGDTHDSEKRGSLTHDGRTDVANCRPRAHAAKQGTKLICMGYRLAACSELQCDAAGACLSCFSCFVCLESPGSYSSCRAFSRSLGVDSLVGGKQS